MHEYELLIETINPCGAAGDSVITTGDGKGILIRYTFTE